MSTFSEATGLLRDMAQVLVLDRLDASRRQASKETGAYCRTVRFHSRSKIRPLTWSELFQKLGVPPVEQVSLPGPVVDLGDVGNTNYYYVLATLIKALQPGLVFEFGTYLGVSALTMAANLPANGRIYTMDLPDNAMPEKAHQLNATDEHHIVKSRTRVGEAFLRSPLQKHITQVRDDSMTYRAEKQVSNVDLVFVDGGHSLPLVTKDTENAFRILANNGTVLWDDYFHAYPDVVTYLDGLANELPLYTIPGTNFVIYSQRWHKTGGSKRA